MKNCDASLGNYQLGAEAVFHIFNPKLWQRTAHFNPLIHHLEISRFHCFKHNWATAFLSVLKLRLAHEASFALHKMHFVKPTEKFKAIKIVETATSWKSTGELKKQLCSAATISLSWNHSSSRLSRIVVAQAIKLLRTWNILHHLSSFGLLFHTQVLIDEHPTAINVRLKLNDPSHNCCSSFLSPFEASWEF